jgi:transposase
MLFPENVGEYLSIDELSLSQGELYTFVTNKNGRGKKGSLVASIKGTLTKDIVNVLSKLPLELRYKVKEVTLDMANNMESAASQSFPKAKLVTDRFHVIRLATEALQHLRVKYRWDELDKENQAIATARKYGRKYKAEELENGDTPKQLLARCRYIIVKKPNEWTKSQQERARLLFNRYPEIATAYKHVLEFRNIYELRDKNAAEARFMQWIEKNRQLGIEKFNTVAYTVNYNMEHILNFFNNRNTYANAESFNSKLKLFRANLRGVVDTKFFLFRIQKLFA